MPPFIATLLAQGLGILGNAVLTKGKDVIEEKLGVDIDALTQTPEGMIHLKQLEIEHEEFLVSSALADKGLDIDNTKNARDSNRMIQESPNASWLAKNAIYLIAFVVILGGGLMVAYSPQADARMAAVSAVMLVLGFFFGSSSQSKGKDATIAALSGVQK